MPTKLGDDYARWPTSGFESKGYDAAYEAVRPKAEAELEATLAGRQSALPDDDLKNPDGEFQNPAPMPSGTLHDASGGGANGPGNGPGNGVIDPQGQQGGMGGGQPSVPGIQIGGRQGGTPLAYDNERIRESTQRKAGGQAPE